MNKNKIVNGYYQSNIKTSRNEDNVYAMKYASQQMLIDKLEHNWNELKKWLECMVEVSHLDINCLKATLDKMQELERGEE